MARRLKNKRGCVSGHLPFFLQTHVNFNKQCSQKENGHAKAFLHLRLHGVGGLYHACELLCLPGIFCGRAQEPYGKLPLLRTSSGYRFAAVESGFAHLRHCSRNGNTFFPWCADLSGFPPVSPVGSFRNAAIRSAPGCRVFLSNHMEHSSPDAGKQLKAAGRSGKTRRKPRPALPAGLFLLSIPWRAACSHPAAFSGYRRACLNRSESLR